MRETENPLDAAMREALRAAREFEGATAPNPAVGAAALAADGAFLLAAAHRRAGEPHAEAALIAECRRRGLKPRTLLITLEPCNHVGRTPPCTDAILALAAEGSLRRIVYGSDDPNPRVQGAGLARLRDAGLKVARIGDLILRAECDRLAAPFAKWITTGIPWVTVKSALDRAGGRIPPPGQKTFTSECSLELAHRLRRRADAILTGSGTILADQPEFTVRRVPDFPGKRRWLMVLDRRGRVPATWVKTAKERGFRVITDAQNLESALRFLGSQSVLEVLVEAGPALTASVLSTSLWDEHVVVTQATREGEPDLVAIQLRAKSR